MWTPPEKPPREVTLRTAQAQLAALVIDLLRPCPEHDPISHLHDLSIVSAHLHEDLSSEKRSRRCRFGRDDCWMFASIAKRQAQQSQCGRADRTCNDTRQLPNAQAGRHRAVIAQSLARKRRFFEPFQVLCRASVQNDEIDEISITRIASRPRRTGSQGEVGVRR